MDILLEEYKLVYSTYEGYQDQILILKGWAITVGLAALFSIYARSETKHPRVVVWAIAISMILFWVLEILWKIFQKSYMVRLEQIEKCFSTVNPAQEYCRGIKTVESWMETYKSMTLGDWLLATIYPHVCLPYLAIFVGATVLATFFPPNGGSRHHFK